MIRLYEFRGRRYLLRELSDLSGVERNVIRARLADGWTLEQALCIPTIKQRRAGWSSTFRPSRGPARGAPRKRVPK